MFSSLLPKESTANVDEWKRQLHTYKEENIRLKREMELLRVGGGAGSGAGGATEDELRREVAALKARTETLQTELLQHEIELKTANMSLREKCNDQTVSNAYQSSNQCIIFNTTFLLQLAKMSELNVMFAKSLSELYAVQKDMENVIHPAKCT